VTLKNLTKQAMLEKETMVRARVISRTLGLDMKLGDVEYQGDKKKATFYYTAEGQCRFQGIGKRVCQRV
jgi:cell fate regulator YaaT (PSP1 superfamily)